MTLKVTTTAVATSRTKQTPSVINPSRYSWYSCRWRWSRFRRFHSDSRSERCSMCSSRRRSNSAKSSLLCIVPPPLCIVEEQPNYPHRCGEGRFLRGATSCVRGAHNPCLPPYHLLGAALFCVL